MRYERRAYHRVTTKLTVRWEGLLTNNRALMTNVSAGGCYINSAGRVSLGEQIGVDTILLSRAHLHLEGSVAHREWPLGFGLRFANLTDEKSALISQVVGEGV
jgi:PilZ domain